MSTILHDKPAVAPLPPPALENRVFFVGLRYGHHAQNSGYEAFCKPVGQSLRPPVGFRWTEGRIGWPVSVAFANLTRHPWYSIGSHLTEWGALMAMLGRRNCIFHFLYADSDLHFLRAANKLTGNLLVASFHQPSQHLRSLGVIENVARNLDAVVLVCEAQRSYFEEFLPGRRIFVVPHGVGSAYFQPPPSQAEAPVCITVGSHLRDFETLRAAIRLVWRRVPGARFVAVGTRSNRKSWFPELDDERVTFLDRISDQELLAAYHSAQVAAFSLEDGTASNAILESMSCGLSIVATRIGGVPEYIGSDAGILCRPKDPAAMADAIIEIFESRGTRRRLSLGARRRAESLDFQKVAGMMAGIYRDLLTESPAA